MENKRINTLHQLICKGHWITDKVTRQLKIYGISEPQYNVLRVLYEAKGKPLDVQTVQRQMVQQSSNVTRIVDKLEKKGLVNRELCPTNRRKMDLTITETGKIELEKMDKEVVQLSLDIIEDLSDQEVTTLTHLLGKLTL